MQVKFTKMHGIGNDFVVFDAINQQIALSAQQVRDIANRRFGVGCDQVLFIESAQNPEMDFYYRIFNADGNEVAQCGNGARCIMQFVHQRGLSKKRSLKVETLSGHIELHLEEDGLINVNMGVPDFEPEHIPFDADAMALSYSLDVADEKLNIGAVSMGNPHAVLQVDNVQTADVQRLGPLIESHPRFPQQVNAGFMQVVSGEHIRLRVYERGAGETLACGSGACAAVAVGRLQELLNDKVTVALQGGDLIIHWSGPGSSLWMKGPATTVFEGTLEI